MENQIDGNKQIEINENDSQAVLSVFGQNSHFAFLYKKTEKLIAAIYLITDFIRDQEPLKWQIREKALELLSLNIRFTTVSLRERRELLKEYVALSLETVSLAGIANVGGLISEMNYSILKREFEKMAGLIQKDENKKANEETVILPPNFFDKAPVSNDVLYTPNIPNQNISKGQISKPADMPHKIENKENKGDRKAIITKLLSKKSGLNIKDFSQAIKGCSEKTIQRELLAMVGAGILKKEGERRWSTYSLVSIAK